MKFATNHLLDLCRAGVRTKNEAADTAGRELLSYIVFAYLLEDEANLPVELEPRVELLSRVAFNPADFPQDMFDEEEVETPLDDGPQVA